MIIITVPYPPSINNYWRRRGPAVYVSAAGKRYRRAVAGIVKIAGVKLQQGRLRVNVTLHPPDNRCRDVDNAMKALLDAMERAGVYEDDEQIDELHISRGKPTPGGMAVVAIGGAQEPSGVPCWIAIRQGVIVWGSLAENEEESRRLAMLTARVQGGRALAAPVDVIRTRIHFGPPGQEGPC